MKQLVEGNLDIYGKKFDPFFFNREDFLSQQACGGRMDLGWLHEKKQALIAQVSFFSESSTAFSPCKGSFGGFNIASGIKPEDLIEFIKKCEDRLRQSGITELSIRQFPDCYAPGEAALLAYCLDYCGFRRSVTELNYHLDLHNGFSSHLRESEPARIKAAEKAGFTFHQEEQSSAGEIYELLKLSRESQGYPVTMASAAFNDMFVQFPEQYQIFTLKISAERIAFAIVVKINSGISYCFYLGEKPEYRKHSPVAYLIWKIAEEARKDGVRMLDLGIGTDRGKPNFGLLAFKQNMGAEASLKVSWKKEL